MNRLMAVVALGAATIALSACSGRIALGRLEICDDDSQALPGFSRPENFEMGRGRVALVEELPVDEAEALAVEQGFTMVIVERCDGSTSRTRPAEYFSETIGLYVDDGVVVRAWTGG